MMRSSSSWPAASLPGRGAEGARWGRKEAELEREIVGVIEAAIRAARRIYVQARRDRVREAHQEYIAATTSSIGRLANCDSPQRAAQALIEEVGAYYSALWEIRQPKLEEARELLIPEQVAAAAAPDFGAGHDLAVLPWGLRGYDAWNDGTAWRPNGSG